VRLATLNVFGLSGNWSDRVLALRNGFFALHADLVILQEAILREGFDQAAAILGPGFQFAHASHREANGSGITTASRWPLGRVVEVDLDVTERTHDFACTSLVTEVWLRSRMGEFGWPIIFQTIKLIMNGNVGCKP
jgi:exonuclease III